MNNDSGKTSVKVDFSLSVVLTIVFVILKLCHVIEWAWVWVLSPLWIGMILSVIIIVIMFLVFKKLFL